MIAVILAGGYGKRMGDMCLSLPKPMLNIEGKTILQRQIQALSAEGIDEFVIVAGYLHEKIVDSLGDGHCFGVKIRYYIESRPMGTGGALKKLGIKEDFLLLNGDLLFKISLKPFLDFHFRKSAKITVYAHPNAHPQDSVLLQYDRGSDAIVSCGRYTAQEDAYPNLCNSGIQVVSPEALDLADEKEYLNFDRDILLPNIKAGQVYAYRNSECILDVGTPDRLQKAEAMVRSGFLEMMKCDVPHKAVFLDRDGTINQYKGFISRPEEIELIPGVAKAIQVFHALGYLVIIITNQPVVARGQCSIEMLQKIHNRLEMLLGMDGAFVDDIYYCPHHPDRGFPGEDQEYKIPCDCRKPSPGMMIKAKEKYNIDLRLSYMVGDSSVDIETAQRAGCMPVYLRCGVPAKQDAECLAFDDLLCFSTYLRSVEKDQSV